MAEIAFVGLGVMGRPMALNLARASHRVRGFTPSPSTREKAETAGLEVSDTLAAAIDGAELVITMLPDSPQVLEVCTGENGLLTQMSATTYVDMSSISPATSRQLHADFAERGIAAVDAPVSGGEQAAIDGTLSIMVGGDADAVARIEPVLALMGTTIAHLGGAGSGQVAKAANQLMVAIHLQALAEAVLFLERNGSDVPKALDVIAHGLAGSTVLDRKAAAMLSNGFAPGFRSALHLKDLTIVQQSARDLGLALPATALVSQLVQVLVARGDGGLDHSALVKTLRELNTDRKLTHD